MKILGKAVKVGDKGYILTNRFTMAGEPYRLGKNGLHFFNDSNTKETVRTAEDALDWAKKKYPEEVCTIVNISEE